MAVKRHAWCAGWCVEGAGSLLGLLHSHLHSLGSAPLQSGRYTKKENGAETKSSTPKPSLSGAKCAIKDRPKTKSDLINW